MKTFDYTVKDELGIHARPAGLLVREATKYKSAITLKKSGKEADLKRLFAVMGLAVKNAETVTVLINGEDEEQAYAAIKHFFEGNL